MTRKLSHSVKRPKTAFFIHAVVKEGNTMMMNRSALEAGWGVATASVMALAFAMVACTHTADTPPSATSGAMDPDSVTMFTLVLQPGSITGCVLGDPSMTRPVKLTIAANKGMLLSEGGIHYSLDRRGPNLYTGGNYIKIVADLTAAPKHLSVSTNDGACKWAASAS
ncbi:MAG: hypothetical protein JSS04_11275 [Proteobacteria bacterium]|nr:hypothetical protein [Pseudomonadota bacterium]